MRILDEEGDKALNRVTLYLTRSEALELRDSIEALLNELSRHHEHIPDADFSKELTVCIYDPNSITTFDDRSRRLITLDA